MPTAQEIADAIFPGRVSSPVFDGRYMPIEEMKIKKQKIVDDYIHNVIM